MNTLTWRNNAFMFRIIKMQDRVSKYAGSIDQCLTSDIVLFACQRICRGEAGYFVICFDQTIDRKIIERKSAMSCCGLGKIDRKSCIIKLSVMIKDGSAKIFGIQCGRQ